MQKTERIEWDPDRAAPASRAFAERLFARFPELHDAAVLERRSGETDWLLLVEQASPNPAEPDGLIVWMEDHGLTPSLAFGRWHTHADVCGGGRPDGDGATGLLDLLGAILGDELVLCETVGGRSEVFPSLIDPTDIGALADEVTDPAGMGRVRLLSWSGAADREVTPASLDADAAP